MAIRREQATVEIELFRRRMSDLAGVVKVAAERSGRARAEIVSVLLDSLRRMFPTDVVHARVEARRNTQRWHPHKVAVTAETADTVFVVDDDIFLRESLALLIGCTGWRVETFSSAREFLARPRVSGASCLVLDVSLPDSSGLDVQRRLALGRMTMPVIFITGHADIPTAVQAMKAGAVEFLTKPCGDRQLVSAIRDALRRSHAALDQEAELCPLRDAFASLSRREREVMARVVAGRLNKHIAAELGISEITVKAHRGRVMRKMKADSLVHLVNMDSRLHLAEAASA